ncbi:MAG: BspA family leucine-rich repeat surface protein [Paludibacter sp.]|nr:BspA family leucine-rich repeat surface protein [Paludibacter sp.]
MKKSIFLLFTVLLTMLSATAATYTVTEITDNGTGATSGSLSWAINASADGDIIAFTLSSGDVITLSAALPVIDNTLTMEGINTATGNPVTIQVSSPGVSTYRVFKFQATGKTLTLNDLIMRGGDVSGLANTDYYGGVIFFVGIGGTLALNHCVVKEGKAAFGGGICASYSTYLLLDGCTVNNNTATSTGGGGVYVLSLNATILNSTITGNTSLAGGGGIYQRFGQGMARLQIINTTISGNSAVNGGGIYTVGAPSHYANCYLLNAIVINNTATSNPDIFKTSTYCNIYPYYLWSSYTTATVKITYTTGDLGDLADNGGPTPTMALSSSAPAYQTGTSAYYNATDGYYYYNGTAYVKILGGTPTYSEADKILTDQRGATRAVSPSMGSYDGELTPPSQPMQLVFTTTDVNQSIELPLYTSVDCTVNWGDGSAPESFTTEGNKAHTFATAGTYTVSISGSLFHFGQNTNGSSWIGKEYLTEVASFGDLGLGSLANAFFAAYNLTSVPATLPSTVNDLFYTFSEIEATSITNLDLWNVKNVTTMSGMFSSTDNFDQDISGWDVSSVTDMSNMFKGAGNFNQNIGNWDVSSVTSMSRMFSAARKFNQNIGNWQVDNVTDMGGMFGGSDGKGSIFNQDISNWNVSKVTNMSGMFSMNFYFNQDIGNWNVSNVETMSSMFSFAIAFNQDISKWNVSKINDMNAMFAIALAFNQNISTKTINEGAANEYIAWNVSNVQDMAYMFAGDIYNMMEGASSAFNQNISNWDVSNVTDMSGMFNLCAFDQNIGTWDISKVTTMENMFLGDTLTTANYNGILTSWAGKSVQSNVTFNAGNSRYSAEGPASARQVLINTYNWTITDGGLNITTNADNSKMNSLSIFPNPVKDYLHIKGLTENSTISVLDLSGKIILSNLCSMNGNINLNNLPTGLYILQISGNEFTTRMKITKE